MQIFERFSHTFFTAYQRPAQLSKFRESRDLEIVVKPVKNYSSFWISLIKLELLPAIIKNCKILAAQLFTKSHLHKNNKKNMLGYVIKNLTETNRDGRLFDESIGDSNFREIFLPDLGDEILSIFKDRIAESRNFPTDEIIQKSLDICLDHLEKNCLFSYGRYIYHEYFTVNSTICFKHGQVYNDDKWNKFCCDFCRKHKKFVPRCEACIKKIDFFLKTGLEIEVGNIINTAKLGDDKNWNPDEYIIENIKNVIEENDDVWFFMSRAYFILIPKDSSSKTKTDLEIIMQKLSDCYNPQICALMLPGHTQINRAIFEKYGCVVSWNCIDIHKHLELIVDDEYDDMEPYLDQCLDNIWEEKSALDFLLGKLLMELSKAGCRTNKKFPLGRLLHDEIYPDTENTIFEINPDVLCYHKIFESSGHGDWGLERRDYPFNELYFLVHHEKTLDFKDIFKDLFTYEDYVTRTDDHSGYTYLNTTNCKQLIDEMAEFMYKNNKAMVLKLPENKMKKDPEEFCVVCWSAPPSYGFFECGHITLCEDCIDIQSQPVENGGSGFHRCPICREVGYLMQKFH